MIRYRLDDLGWFQFEWLCQSLLKATFSIGIESWGGHSDFGRDAFCNGMLPLDGKDSQVEGPFVFQAKFVSEANAAGADASNAIKAAVTGETKRIIERIQGGQIEEPQVYVLLTNAPISASQREAIKELLSTAIPKTRIIIWESNDICDLLDNAPNIRVAFPQLLGLRDLTELLRHAIDAPLVERSTLALEQATELAAIFVPTSAYNLALAKLSEHGFVVLTGPPEMGKTTIARLIGLAKTGEKWECHECRTPDDFFRLKRTGQKQVFIADDAFGTTEYRPEIAHAWAMDMDRILRSVDLSHWLLWTSRPAPLHLALRKMHLQGRAEKFPQPGEILIDAAKLSFGEKALILYRHAKAANLEGAAKLLVKSNAQQIVQNNHFTPERIRRFVKNGLPRLVALSLNGDAIGPEIVREIEQATESMKKSFTALSAQHQNLLIAMLDVEASFSGYVSLAHLKGAYSRLVGADVDVSRLATDLSAHFLRFYSETECPTCGSETDERFVGWMHPSWRDLVIERLAVDGNARREFLMKCGTTGALLAISTAGGASGRRKTPLLNTVEDWNSLSASVVRIVQSSESTSRWKLLLAVLELAHSGDSVSPGSRTAVRPISDLASCVLAACRSRWTLESWTVSATELEIYYDISERLEPLPPSPDLKSIWDASANAARQQVESFDSEEGDIYVSDIDDFLEIARQILDNEPRFLRQVDFPRSFTEEIQQFLPRLSERAKLKPELTTDDECDKEDEELSEIDDLIVSIDDLFPELSEDIAKAREAVRSGSSYVESRRKIIKEEEEEREQELRQLNEDPNLEPYDTSAEKSTTTAQPREIPKHHPIENVDVTKLFEDL